MTIEACPFCPPPTDRVFYRDELVIGLWDGYPVTPGHALLIPVRHTATWFDATLEEQQALMRALEAARNAIEAQGAVDGFNIGINSGAAAGQTVFHLHVHVIPRRRGDVVDPRGGVRHVFPEKANYVRDRDDSLVSGYTSYEQVLTTGESDPLLPHLKRHLVESQRADFAVAFTLRSGLELLQPHLQDFLDRGGRLRLLTGDYLNATDPDALLRLADLRGQVESRIYQTVDNGDGSPFGRSFHPKVYIFEHRDGSGAAFVGSSNLTRTALTSGVEWNYKVLDARDRAGLSAVRGSFEKLFSHRYTQPLSAEWISDYRRRRDRDAATNLPVGGLVPADPPLEIPTPHAIQQEALTALRSSRKSGHHAGLVVLATGLGKTWLSAFDSLGFQRVLFVAHREEILSQALQTFRHIRPHDRLGMYTGEEKDAGARVLFASIQALSRAGNLRRFAADAFDYIVVDEFHHAEASTYRRVLGHFRPAYLLGLTATPERSDGADLLALCDDNLVYRCDLTEGIRAGLLCPFRYFGVPDNVDYRNIPWRSRRFDEEKLTEALATQARAENALEQYRLRAGKRTIAFCVSQRHADFMRDFFNRNGVSARSVHAGPTSDPRAPSLEDLRDGRLSVLCAVDMFNEGVDVPELDTVMMLRPTESKILWLQQFGRGLRVSHPGKRLTVIDYIGNHRSFLLKPQALFSLPAGDHAVLNLLQRLDDGTADLPEGCEVTYDLEVKNIFRGLLLREGSAVDLLTRRYRDFEELLGVRPTAAEMFREGYNPRVVRTAFGSWLGFVRAQGGLTEDEARALDALQAFLGQLEVTEMTKSYKMLVLLALLDEAAIPGRISIAGISRAVGRLAAEHSHIAEDLGNIKSDASDLEKVLRSHPIKAWSEGHGTGGVPYFALQGDEFSFVPAVDAVIVAPFQALVRELVDWRLAEYFRRAMYGPGEEYVLSVKRSGEQPMLFLPSRDANPELPEGWTDIQADGETVQANFVKVALNVVRRSGSEENALPALLVRWFGADAGRPGTKHIVKLRRDADQWRLQPAGVSTGAVVPYRVYTRAQIAPLFGLSPGAIAQQGFFVNQRVMILLVTLDKSGHEEAFRYKDRFETESVFKWQSQNRTTQASKHGVAIRDHASLGIDVHLFVRNLSKTQHGKGAPFYYLGQLDFVDWSGEQPISVTWRMRSAVPPTLRLELSVGV